MLPKYRELQINNGDDADEQIWAFTNHRDTKSHECLKFYHAAALAIVLGMGDHIINGCITQFKCFNQVN
jgi:hypothetical protein